MVRVTADSLPKFAVGDNVRVIDDYAGPPHIGTVVRTHSSDFGTGIRHFHVRCFDGKVRVIAENHLERRRD